MALFQTRLKWPLSHGKIYSSDVSFIGRFKNGKPSGNFWYKMVGGGFMHGSFNEEGKATGNNLAFIYPDMETALIGNFEDLVMKSAHEAEVIDAACDEDGLVVVSKFSNISGPEFYYEAPTNESFGAGPDGVIDPYERKTVKVSQSTVPESGDGVFAIRDLPPHRCTSYFNGFLYDSATEDILYELGCVHNQTLTMDQRRQCKKYSLGLTNFKAMINIPPEQDEPGVFQPTVGQKVTRVLAAMPEQCRSTNLNCQKYL